MNKNTSVSCIVVLAKINIIIIILYYYKSWSDVLNVGHIHSLYVTPLYSIVLTPYLGINCGGCFFLTKAVCSNCSITE